MKIVRQQGYAKTTIGTEELPAGDLDAALEQLQTRLPAWLDDLRLAHGRGHHCLGYAPPPGSHRG